jgi:ADP-ribose pyrophosphatase
MTIHPWKTLSSTTTFQDNFLHLRTDRCQRADGHVVPTYHVLEFTPWVTIIPLTDAGNIVLAREYRHASGKVITGLPGGVSDPGERDWAMVGLRELAEETGYAARDMIHVGTCYPNPATQDNELHFYLALGCTPSKAQALDPNEDIEVIEMPYEEFLEYGAQPVQHGLHAAGLFYTEAYFRQHPEKRPPTEP